MEKPPQHHEGISSEMEDFQEEMSRLKEEERAHGKTVHLVDTLTVPELEPSNLTEEDMRVWEKYKVGELSISAFREYRDAIPHGATDRHTFAAFVANKMMASSIVRSKPSQE